MNKQEDTGNQYFRMAVIIALISMTALISLHLGEYTRHGLVFLLIPISVCVALLAICVPLIRYLKKIWRGASESGYFQAANLFAVFSMVSFILIRLPDYISSALYGRALVLLSACLSVIAIMILLMIKIKSVSPLAFYIPAVTFALYTLGTLILGGTSYYFLTYLVICGFGSLYNYYARYRNFIVLSHIVILCLIAAGLPLLGREVSQNDVILHWFIAAYTTVFFLMLSRFSTEKSSRSERAQLSFGTLMAATPNLLAIVDERNKVTYISKPLADLAHIEDHEMAVGRPVIDLFHDINMKLVIGEILESDGFYDGTLDLFHDGEKRYFKIISDKFPGTTPGRFIDMSDITPIMEARFEAEEAKARAEEANSAKSAFLARMSHEIRTPMNAITGMSELILREEASPSVYEHAAAVKQAGSNLVAIINDILDFSKIESGKMEIIPTEYEFSSLINDVITIIRMRLREKPICFAVNVDSAIPQKLCGDVVRVRQILLNLLSNAAKYTHKGHIIFTVGWEEIENESLVLKFEISDTGIGIKPEDIAKLFGDFSRVDIRVNQGVEGTGLGLAITRNLCRAMGGDVAVESTYGEGSTFTARIPQEIRDRTPFASVAEPETKKVLIYEPRVIYGNSIVYSVANLGVSCKLVTGAEDFIRALEADHCNFIFVASFLFEKAQEEVRRRGIDTTLVLLAEYGEVIASRQLRFIAMPAHSISIANILNGVEDLRHYNEEGAGIRFTAPEARVLIVDDIKTNLTVAEGLLAPYLMQIDSCLNGVEAVSLVRKNSYDLVLMDHMMPGMDGIETTAVIRAWEKEEYQKRAAEFPGGPPGELPIIALTANAVSGMKNMFLDAGFNDYISKPIEIVKLDDILSRWIPDRKKRRRNAAADETPAASLAAIPGVDVQKGLAMTGGTEAGYRKVLRQFGKDAAERLPFLSRVPEEGELAAFVIHTHALKSAAGAIGAAELSGEAAALEAAGKAGNLQTIREILPLFYGNLARLVEGLEKALEEKKDGEMRAENEAQALRFPLSALKEALGARNMRAIDRLLEEIEKIPLDGKTMESIGVISDKVLMGEYREALDEVDRLEKALISAKEEAGHDLV
jgi:CheY-like chemotaxis protein/nitrogen-specific signal transduction histidine kinase